MSQTLKATVRLREYVLSGQIKPGQRISENNLVERLGVSRTPIRAALQKLEGEGLFKASASGGFEINSFTITDVVDTIEVRGVLEGMAARTAAEHGIRRADWSELAETFAKMENIARKKMFSTEDLSQFSKLNHRFHTQLVHYAGNRVLECALLRIWALPFGAPSAFVFASLPRPEIVRCAQIQHRAIVEAIEKGKGARAESISRKHVEVAKINARAALEDQAKLKQVPGWSLISDL